MALTHIASRRKQRGKSQPNNPHFRTRYIATEVVTALELPNSADSTRHVIGNIAFDDDGMLYISVGEDNNGSLSQLLSDPRGKILRFEPTIPLIAPEDNPFFDADGPNYDGIYAYGLRNSFDFVFDPFS